jgi:hypothetical protein
LSLAPTGAASDGDAVARICVQDLFSGKKLASPAGQLGILAQQLALSPAPFNTVERIHALPTGAAAQRKLTRPSAADILCAYLGLPVRTKRRAVAAQLARRP